MMHKESPYKSIIYLLPLMMYVANCVRDCSMTPQNDSTETVSNNVSAYYYLYMIALGAVSITIMFTVRYVFRWIVRKLEAIQEKKKKTDEEIK